jgi:hypothetical protein
MNISTFKFDVVRGRGCLKKTLFKVAATSRGLINFYRAQIDMTAIVTFVIPVRHQDNCNDWSKLKSNLTQTILSISKQTNPNWRAVIVANLGANLPDLPDKVEVLYVDFPPNQLYRRDRITKKLFYEAVRLDKGKRVLSGMLSLRDTNFYMVVDDDDLISNRLVDFLSKQIHVNGWKVKEGYVWGDGGKMLLINREFHYLCGTSLIIRADLYNLPERMDQISDHEIKTIYGSHIKVIDHFLEKGVTLNVLPFRATIYRVGYGGSHSLSPKFFKFILNKKMILRPHRFILNLLSLRVLTNRIKKEFSQD